MDTTPTNRYNTVPRLVEASRRLGLPVVVPTDEDLVDRTTVEQSAATDPGTTRVTIAVTVVLNTDPRLVPDHLTSQGAPLPFYVQQTLLVAIPVILAVGAALGALVLIRFRRLGSDLAIASGLGCGIRRCARWRS